MARSVGVTLSEQIHTGLVVDHKLVGGLRQFPEDEEDYGGLVELHTDALVETMCEQVLGAANGDKNVASVGVAVPGLVKNGVVEEAPNLPAAEGRAAARPDQPEAARAWHCDVR